MFFEIGPEYSHPGNTWPDSPPPGELFRLRFARSSPMNGPMSTKFGTALPEFAQCPKTTKSGLLCTDPTLPDAQHPDVPRWVIQKSAPKRGFEPKARPRTAPSETRPNTCVQPSLSLSRARSFSGYLYLTACLSVCLSVCLSIFSM